MYSQLHYLVALQVVRERTRATEARARLSWSSDPAAPVAERLATRFAAVCRAALGQAGPGHGGQCVRLERASTPPAR